MLLYVISSVRRWAAGCGRRKSDYVRYPQSDLWLRSMFHPAPRVASLLAHRLVHLHSRQGPPSVRVRACKPSSKGRGCSRADSSWGGGVGVEGSKHICRVSGNMSFEAGDVGEIREISCRGADVVADVFGGFERS